MHRFNSDLIIDEKPAIAKITLFEKKIGNNKIYSLELESLENPAPLNSLAQEAEQVGEAQSAAAVRNETATIATPS